MLEEGTGFSPFSPKLLAVVWKARAQVLPSAPTVQVFGLTPYFRILTLVFVIKYNQLQLFHECWLCEVLSVIHFCGNMVFEVNIEVCCHFCCSSVVLFGHSPSSKFPIIHFQILPTILLGWWSLAMLCVHNNVHKNCYYLPFLEVWQTTHFN